MPPLVSILIPCYNAELWLAETLESALNQTWQPIEIILVDDGSTDRSLAIAQSYQSPKLKVITQPNQGASAARNWALKLAQGDFVQYLDADDVLAPDKIEQQVKRLLQEDANSIASGAWARFYTDYSEAQFYPQPLWADFHPIDWLLCAWEGNWMMHPAAWLIPRPIVDRVGGWNESLSLNDDGEYFCRVVLASCAIKFCPESKVYYRSGINGSLSGSKSLDAWNSLWRSLQLDQTHVLNQEHSPRTRRACANRWQRLVYDLYPHYPNLLCAIETEIQQLGGADLPPVGSPLFQQAAAILGWQTAKRLQGWSTTLRSLTKLTLSSTHSKSPKSPNFGGL
ncbi:glycosyltransferase family 2 protein [Pantanalinema rosaneae CENA516]|uniref:glycosyltransferase family 2 protein n=1 Tax=Pantanalinema rosaneae TaxID=1620701 RepID=UPI003D6F6C00